MRRRDNADGLYPLSFIPVLKQRRGFLLQSILPAAIACLLLVALFSSCSLTRNVPDGQYTLRSNKINLKSDERYTERGTLTDVLGSVIVQKPNTTLLGLPYKVYLYNLRARRYRRDTAAAAFQLRTKTVETPVLYDSSLTGRSAVNMRGYLASQGYFYADVRDTTEFKGKKAYAIYNVNTGYRYSINTLSLDIDDSAVASIVRRGMGATLLVRGQPFSYTTVQAERSRISDSLRNLGYYKFSPENVSFDLDTGQRVFRYQPGLGLLGSAVKYVATGGRRQEDHATDIRVIIRNNADGNAYQPYRISRLTIYPDFRDRTDYRDSSMRRDTAGGVFFRFHDDYVRRRVLLNHIFLEPDRLYSQKDYDQTITQLNALGIFQYVRINIRDDTATAEDGDLRATILTAPAQRYDFSTNLELSNGSTYAVGNALSFNFYNRNLFRGANQLTISLSGGLEAGYDTLPGKNFLRHFYLLSRNAGINGSLSFPKFLGPYRRKWTTRNNLPNTIISVGVNLLDRVNFFTLINTKANFSYNWRQSITNTWDLTPAFINILTLPQVSDSFQRQLNANEFLANSYREVFVEGENLTFTYNSQPARPLKRNYTYLRAGIEEAGGLVGGIDLLNGSRSLGINYSQYVKLDLDVRQYYRLPKSLAVLRFFSGIGMPYRESSTLPYIKQYFVGGAYSIRGWRIRSLGPGSYVNSNATQNSNFIDRTGDIKLEANAEYRFDVLQLFAGSLRLAGALFTDAGNIWLARPDDNYPGGEFHFSTFARQIAVSSGAGARVDIGGLFVLRLDGGFPVRKPSEPENDGWVINKIQFGNKEWRQKNVVLSVAIGYPF